MKILKSLIISLLIVIMSCGFAYAGEGALTVSAEAKDGVISVNGSAPDGVKTLVAVKIADPNGKIIYMNDKYSEDDGSFSFVMPIAEKIKGSYSVWASCLGYENAKCEAYLDVKSENEILAFSRRRCPGQDKRYNRHSGDHGQDRGIPPQSLHSAKRHMPRLTA